ncbi:39S ribosomal protein L36, mitochondrial [Macrosteles quadrilineatus]|uniref:39S ribosomal protein L36, mitochondrial n=1 Tax=Macrosteles quadrilineatus TaxID=74068 RepID=UPI0023E28B68|nr:39S ribosomal protein L36, mitochondrial [Macrosteles quadrilineatus]
MNFIVKIFRQSITNANPPVNSVTQVAKTLLQPVLPTLNFVNGFKMRYAVKRRCRDCWLEIRDGRIYNLCLTHPRHKQMGLKTHDKKKRILTWAGMSKRRAW